jgi:hypothetical protein
MRQRGEGGWIRIGELLPAYLDRLEKRWRRCTPETQKYEERASAVLLGDSAARDDRAS